MTVAKKDEPVTIDPVTTAPGVLGERGLIPIGTRLTSLPVEQFSDKWMKAVTKQDQNKVKSHQTRLAAEKKAAAGPDVGDAIEAADEVREQIKSVNGKLGAMQQKMEAMQAAIEALQKPAVTKEDPKVVAKKPEPKPADEGKGEKPEE